MNDNTQVKMVRTMLRRIEEHNLLAQLDTGALCETVNMMEIIHHPEDARAEANYATPRRSAAWVSAPAVREGLARLQALERTPHVVYLEGLLLPVFRQTLTSVGLEWTGESLLLVHQDAPSAAGDAHIVDDSDGLARWWSGWRTLRFDAVATGAPQRATQTSLRVMEDKRQVYCLLTDASDAPCGVGRLALQPAVQSAEIDRFEATDAAAAGALLAALTAAAGQSGSAFLFVACAQEQDLLLAAAAAADWTLAGKSVRYATAQEAAGTDHHDTMAQPVPTN